VKKKNKESNKTAQVAEANAPQDALRLMRELEKIR